MHVWLRLLSPYKLALAAAIKTAAESRLWAFIINIDLIGKLKWQSREANPCHCHCTAALASIIYGLLNHVNRLGMTSSSAITGSTFWHVTLKHRQRTDSWLFLAARDCLIGGEVSDRVR
jgi:hypothetical protein